MPDNERLAADPASVPPRRRRGSRGGGERGDRLRPSPHHPGPSSEEEGPSVAHAPERTCILSGRKAGRNPLIRLALAPDVRAKAPGRGAWIGVDRAALEQAIARGRLAKALARAFRSAVTVPADLPAQIERALERAALDRLGLEARAGQVVTGAERIADAARKGTVALLLHARDAAADGTRKLDQALRVGLGAEGGELRGLGIPATRAILSMALGRENVVHLALVAPASAARVSEALVRWRGYIGLDGEPGGLAEGSQGSIGA